AARAARQARTDAETLRLLYVALTRARGRVIILGRACGNRKEGFDEGSWWDVLSRTFGALPEVQTLPSRRRRFRPEPVRVGAAGAAAVPAGAGPRYAAPSRREDAARLPAPSPLASAGPGAPLGRFRRGDLIHRLLERLPEIAPADRPDAARRLLARERDLDDAQRAEMTAA